MITKEAIKELNEIRAERRRLEKLDKELTARLIADAEGETEKAWKGLSYKISEGKNTSADWEKIQKLDNWEQYRKVTTYPKLTIGTGK